MPNLISRSRSSDFNETNNNEGSYGSDHLIRLFQVLPFNDTEDVTANPDLHKLLNVIYISSRDTKWQVSIKFAKAQENIVAHWKVFTLIFPVLAQFS